MTMKAVIHYNSSGGMTVYADQGVELFFVDDRSPDDRVYKMNPAPIPSDMLAGDVGSADDGGQHMLKVKKFFRVLNGEAPFDVIKGGAE